MKYWQPRSRFGCGRREVARRDLGTGRRIEGEERRVRGSLIRVAHSRQHSQRSTQRRLENAWAFVDGRNKDVDRPPGWVIAGIALAQNDSDQVVWTGGVVAILHFGSDFVVGLGGDLGKRNSRRVIAKRTESFNLGHLGALELYQVDGDYP